MNQMIRLSARSTPGTERTRWTAVSGNVWAKSTFGVLREVTQRSARDVVDRDRGVVEEAEEEADLDEHERDGERDARHGDQEPQLVVEEALRREVDHVTAPRAAEAADHRLDQLVTRSSSRRATRPSRRCTCTCGARRRRGRRPRPSATRGPRPRTPDAGGPRAIASAAVERRNAYASSSGLPLRDPAVRRCHARRLRRHEHQPVVVGVLEGEGRVDAPDLPQALDRVGDRRRCSGTSAPGSRSRCRRAPGGAPACP